MTKTLHKHGVFAVVLMVVFAVALAGVCFAMMGDRAAVAYAEGTHEHDGIVFTEWTSSDLPTAAGNYYLTRDYTGSSNWTPATGVTRLCLNGHKIVLSGNRSIILNSGAELHIYDCDTTTHYYHTESSGSYTWATVTDTPTENDLGSFQGGYIGASVNSGNCNNAYIGGVRGKTGSTAYLHSGTLVGAYGASTDGGAFYRYSSSDKPYYYIEGGNILGTVGTAVIGDTVGISGGTIKHNIAQYGTVSAKELTISGGTITQNYSTAAGGFGKEAAIVNWKNLYLSGNINISGNYVATVSAGTITPSDKEVDLYSDYYSDSVGTIHIVGPLNLAAPVYNDFSAFNSGKSRKTITDGFSTYVTTTTPTDYFRTTKDFDVRLTAAGEVEYVDMPYTVTFNDSDNETISSAKKALGDAIVPATAPAKVGYVFAGWSCSLDEEVYTAAQVAEMTVSQNVTFTATYQQEYVEFTVNVTGETTRYIDGTNVGDAVVVTYKITHNDGFNSMLLVPAYNADVFSIDSIAINETALGAATFSEGTGTKKFLVENTGVKYTALDGENEFFVTITYKLKAAIEGEYEFGLVLDYAVNNSSVAYYIADGESKGEQNQVDIKVVRLNTLKLIAIKTATIEIGANNTVDKDVFDVVYDYFFIYSRQEVGVEQVETLTPVSEADDFYVEYTYSGDADEDDIVITWYYADVQYDEELQAYVAKKGSALEGAPVGAGDYVIGISAPATAAYYAVAEVYGYVHINTRNLYVTIASKSSVYGEALKPLTYTVQTQPYAGDTLNISLNCAVTTSSNAGSYPITGSETHTGSYVVVFTDGTYTITKKALTLTAKAQTAVYSGSPFVPDDTKYTWTIGETTYEYGEYTLGSVDITTVENYVSAGVYAGVLVPNVNFTYPESADNYDITKVNGTLTITTAGIETQEINAFFTGLEFTYDKQSHDLLAVSSNFPTGYMYQVTGNVSETQTNAGSYVISIRVTADNNHHLEGNQSELLTSVTGIINKAAVEVTADNCGHVYRGTPASLTYQVTSGTVYSGDSLNVAMVVKNNDQVITLSKATDAGEYTIEISASNANYNITKVNGVYTVSKATPVVTVTAQNVYYNRDLAVSGSATVGDLAVTPTIKYYTDSECTQEIATPENAGTYYVKASVAATANYNAASDTASFNINAIQIALPSVSYDGNTMTLGNSTQDVEGVALKEGTALVYTINGEEGQSYTATATSNGISYTVASSNNSNYLINSGNSSKVYSVSFADKPEDHPLNTAVPANIPSDVFYVFSGQSITIPATAPTLAGYSFGGWDGNGKYYQAGATTLGITENKTMLAGWSAVNYTISFKYVADGAVAYSASTYYYGDPVTYPTAQVSPVRDSEIPGIAYEFAEKWSYNAAEYGYTEDDGTTTLTGITVSGNMTFVAVFDEVYGVYTITYYFSENESTSAYEQYGEKQNVTYGETITYRVFEGNTYAWFKTDYWYANPERTQAVPAIMPAENINVYGSYKFNIGQGDVNANGKVDANDITLYRQWIVGGYTMTEVTAGTEWAKVTDSEFDPTAVYFLERVADNNGDEYRDIRDVSITRMSVVGGYAWDITNGESVSGHAIMRNAVVGTVSAIINGLNNVGRATLYANITEDTGVIEVSKATGSLTLDLGGKTLDIKTLSLTANGAGATITIKNGILSAAQGITIVAPNGNVVIENVTAYVDGAEINLQAASSSLHFAGLVKFFDGTIADVNPEPAVINVENGTHVVIEKAADVVVDKVVVTENFVESSTAAITINNNSTVVTEVTVEGKATNEINSIASMVAAFANGGEYVLTADVVYNGSPTVTANTVLDLNGHMLRSANNVAIFVGNGARLTINGDATGRVIAQEAAVTVLDGSELVVNGGTFTAQDNFVFGTNGSTGRGGNKITVNGGVINGNIQSAGYVACGIYVANSDVVVVNGGTFNVVNGCGILARSGNTTVGANVVFNVEGSGNLGKVGDSQVTVPTGEALVLDLKAAYPGGVPTLNNNSQEEVYVVVDGTYTFAGDDATFHAARGVYDNVILTGDFDDYLYVNRNMNIYLNGHTVDASATEYVAIYATNGASVTINGQGNVIGTEGCVLVTNNSSLVVNGGTYTCYDNFVIGTNGTEGLGGNTITVNGGVFNGGIVSAGYVACGIYVANSDTVAVNGGTFNVVNGCGILARSGNTTVGANVVFNVEGSGNLGKVGDSKVTVPTGEALVLDLKANYPGGVPTLNNNSTYTVYTIVAE